MRKHYFPRYREPMRIDSDIIWYVVAVLAFAYLIICPLLHTCGVEPNWWSWVYWLGEYIDTLK